MATPAAGGGRRRELEAAGKTPSHIDGLDEVLGGGLPAGLLTVISGGPGSGKTILGLEFLVRGAQAGVPGILLTFEELEDSLRRYGRLFDWDIPALEAAGLLRLVAARLEPDAVLSGDFDLGSSLAILGLLREEIGAQQVVVDAPDVFLRLLDKPSRERAELYRLHSWLRDHQ